MPAPAAATLAAKAALAVLRTRRGRRMVLALVGGLLSGLTMILIVLISSVGAVVGTCQQEAGEASQGASSEPYGSSEALFDTSGAPGPAYVSQEWSEEALSDIPQDYLPLYEKAAGEYGLDAAVLAAIGKIETDHGRYGGACAASSAGARGPMQFISSTWATTGVDGNGDGRKDVCDPADAISSGANYLKLSGAPQDYHSAILAYNHAEWYYQDVVAQAERYQAAGGGEGGGEMAGSSAKESSSILATLLSPLATRPAYAQGAAGAVRNPEEPSTRSEVESDATAIFPLPEQHFDSYENTWGASRGGDGTHEGTDMFAPEGTPIYSITSGKVVRVSGSDSQGWDTLGGWTAMIEAADSGGPVEAGDTLYYAHMLEPSSLRPGDTVQAGDVIGKVGSTGEGPPGTVLPDGRGEHLHLGWYDPTGERAETASGAMNPYPLLEWLHQNGGTATGEGTVALGVPFADLPAYCAPLRAFGLVPTLPEPSGGIPLASGEPSAELGADVPTGPGSATGQQVVEEAKKYLGTPYVLGGPEACDPGAQMDCTCLTTTVFREFGRDLPDVPTDLMRYGKPVEGEPQAGDVLVWGDPGDGTGGHAAISLGNGQIIHANMGTMDTAITPMWDSPRYMGARRLVE